MDTLLRKLVANGFLICPAGEKFLVRKVAVPENPSVLADIECETYDEAVATAQHILQVAKPTVQQTFTAIVRYNRGLGIEYRNLPVIHATTLEEAQTAAARMAEKLLGGPKVVIQEIRVRPNNRQI